MLSTEKFVVFLNTKIFEIIFEIREKSQYMRHMWPELIFEKKPIFCEIIFFIMMHSLRFDRYKTILLIFHDKC